MSDETNYAIVTAARRILAKEQSLPLDELVRRITEEESSPDSNRALVVKNILKQYIATGYFAQNGDTVCAYNGPSEVLLERGFKQTHVNHGTGNEVLRHFSNSAFPLDGTGAILKVPVPGSARSELHGRAGYTLLHLLGYLDCSRSERRDNKVFSRPRMGPHDAP